jgi:hypothetical protein
MDVLRTVYFHGLSHIMEDDPFCDCITYLHVVECFLPNIFAMIRLYSMPQYVCVNLTRENRKIARFLQCFGVDIDTGDKKRRRVGEIE